jgi:hypothetical protein
MPSGATPAREHVAALNRLNAQSGNIPELRVIRIADSP